MANKRATANPEMPFAVQLSPRGATRLQGGHVWVYRSDVSAAKDLPAGALVGVTDSRGKFLGTALYSSSSQIAIRMISREPVADLPALVAERIRAAIAYRKRVVANSNAYRVVFSEADLLPGLIVDHYNDVLSVQILTQAMDAEPLRSAVLKTLVEELQPAGIVERVDPRIRELEQLTQRKSGLCWGEKSSSIIAMNFADSGDEAGPPGVRFQHDGLEGQKTGAFLDQRENYAAAAQYARGEALDVFCYQGGFALHFAIDSAVHSALHPAGKCSNVTGVDSSRPALEMAEKNAMLNGRELEWIEANTLVFLWVNAPSGRRYDTIVLDPPAFAKT